jgi:hypothetical protein
MIEHFQASGLRLAHEFIFGHSNGGLHTRPALIEAVVRRDEPIG